MSNETIEQLARELDDETISVRKSARKLAPNLNRKMNTIRNILQAKRMGFKSINNYVLHRISERGFNSKADYKEHLAKEKGFDSYGQYKLHLAKKRGFKDLTEYRKHITEKRGFKSLTEYNNHLARKRGFKDQNDYADHLAIKAGAKDRFEYQANNNGFDTWGGYLDNLAQRRGFLSNSEYHNFIENRKDKDSVEEFIQKKFDRKFYKGGLTTITKDDLDSLPYQEQEDPQEKTRRRHLAIISIKALGAREKNIIYQRYLAQNPQSLEMIGRDLGLTRERVRQIEKGALGKMRRYLKREGFVD